MIRLPSDLTPSELLWSKDLPTFISELLSHSRSLRREGKLPQASRCARDAMKADQKPGTKLIQATALVHLADARREMGRLGPALDDYQNAHRYFMIQSSRYQRHNEAIGAYALGLVHQLLGSDMDALKWYQDADTLLERVKDDWAACKALDRVKVCNQLQAWMEVLGRYLTSARARMDADLDSRIWMPTLVSEDEPPTFALGELEIDKYVIGREMTIDGVPFRVEAIKGRRRISLNVGVKYYAVTIPPEARGPLGAEKGDYALVVREQEADREGPAVVKTLVGPEFGHFERDDQDEISFVRTDATVIGAEAIEEGQIGYITALLKPE